MASWNHELIIGDSYEPVTYVTLEEDGTAVDLTDCTGEVELKADVNAAPVLLTPTFSIVDAALGRFTWTAAASATASLSPGKAYYSVRLTFPSGSVRTVLDGEVTIARRATS